MAKYLVDLRAADFRQCSSVVGMGCLALFVCERKFERWIEQ